MKEKAHVYGIYFWPNKTRTVYGIIIKKDLKNGPQQSRMEWENSIAINQTTDNDDNNNNNG